MSQPGQMEGTRMTSYLQSEHCILPLPINPVSLIPRYFEELNSQLFRVLLEAAGSEDHVLTVEMVEGVQLDPIKDRLFLTELASTYGLDYTLQRPQDMFSCCL